MAARTTVRKPMSKKAALAWSALLVVVAIALLLGVGTTPH